MRTKNSARATAGLLVAIGLLVAPIRSQAAAAPGGMTISPATATLSLAPGQNRQEAGFTITNHYSSPIRLHFGFAQPVGTPGAAHSAVAQLGITPDDVMIGGGESIAPAISLTDDSALAPGSQQAVLTITQQAAPGSSVSVVPSIRMPLIIIKQAGALTSLRAGDIRKPAFAVHVPESAAFTLRNTGNVVAIPHGYVSLQDPRGREVSRSVLNTASTAIPPGGQLQLSAAMTPLGHAWLPGTYRLAFSYGAGGGAAAKTISVRFVYVPLWEILGIILLLGTLLYCIWQTWKARPAARTPKDKPPAKASRPLLAGRDI